jgi:hypothetical protein
LDRQFECKWLAVLGLSHQLDNGDRFRQQNPLRCGQLGRDALNKRKPATRAGSIE